MMIAKVKELFIEDEADTLIYKVVIVEKWRSFEVAKLIEIINKILSYKIAKLVFTLKPTGNIRIDTTLEDIIDKNLSVPILARILINLIRYQTGRINDLCIYKTKKRPKAAGKRAVKKEKGPSLPFSKRLNLFTLFP
jgi:hypothetical protein